jgi:hypothetical protein
VRIHISILIFATALCGGCLLPEGPYAHYKSGQGDAGEFILQRAALLGIAPAMTNGLPQITGHWSYRDDDQGVGIRMSQEQCQLVEDFLRQSFGQPTFGPTALKGDKDIGAKWGRILLHCYDGDTVVYISRPFQRPPQ